MALNLFPALFDCPTKIKFAYQEEDEQIDLLLRQHWVVNIPWILSTILALLLPLLVINFRSYLGEGLISSIPGGVFWVALILWYMLVLAYLLEKYLYWYFNIYIVTNKHLISIDFHSLLQRHTTEAYLQDFQSARSKVGGVFGSFFNFGDVVIETAAERQKIEFLSIPRPDFVADRIQDLKDIADRHPGGKK